MTEQNCKYYLAHEGDDNYVFEHSHIGSACALLSCKNNEGRFSVENAGLPEVGACSTDRFIEGGIPVDKKGKVIDLESELEEDVDLESELEEDVDLDGFEEYKNVRILDPKTNQPFAD